MSRSKRTLGSFFLEAADDILTEKDQALRKVKVPTNGNLVASKEGEHEVLTLP